MAKEVECFPREYLAGFFDARGRVRVFWRGIEGDHISRAGYTLRAYIVYPSHLALFDDLLARFGGSLQYNPDKRMWRWVAEGHLALVFLKGIAPCLVKRRKQVHLAIQFQERREERGGQPLSPEELTYEDGISISLRAAGRQQPEECEEQFGEGEYDAAQ